MNNLLIALTATMMAFSAFAQDPAADATNSSAIVAKKKVKAKKKKKPNAAKAATLQAPVAAVSVDSSSAMPVAAAPAAAQSTTTDIAKSVDAKKLLLELTVVNDVSGADLSLNGKQEVMGYVSAGYKFDADNRITARHYMGFTKLGVGGTGVQQDHISAFNPMVI